MYICNITRMSPSTIVSSVAYMDGHSLLAQYTYNTDISFGPDQTTPFLRVLLGRTLIKCLLDSILNMYV